MKLIGKLAGLAAVAALLYGATFFTQDRADPRWSRPADKALAARPAEGPAAPRPSARDKAIASSQAPWSGPVAADRVLVPSRAQAVEFANAQAAKHGTLRAAADPDSTGSLPVTSATAQPIQATSPHAAATHRPTPPSSVKLARSKSRLDGAPQGRVATRAPARLAASSRPERVSAPAFRQAYAAVPSLGEPIQFRLAERGN